MAKTALKIFINKGVAPSQRRYPDGGFFLSKYLKVLVFEEKKAVKHTKTL